MTRRTVALFLPLFAAYAATIGLRATAGSDYAGDEPRNLRTADAIVDDWDLQSARQGIGFPLLIAPAKALGGDKGVELFLAAIAALALALAYRLALRVAPDPWAIGATAAVGLSPPVLAYSTAVYPELAAGAALTGAALLAMRLDGRVSRREAFLCFFLLGSLPWMSVRFVPAGVVIGFVAARGLWRARRRTLGVGAIEMALFSVAFYVAINEQLFGGPTPYSGDGISGSPTGAGSVSGYAERLPRLGGVFVDPGYGLLRWAPVVLLAFAGLWFLFRSRRELLARAVPGVRDIELAGGMCAAAIGTQLLVAVFLAPDAEGPWFPARHMVAVLPLAAPLCAWGLRHLPRVGTALAVVTVAVSAWLYVDVRVRDGQLVGDHQAQAAQPRQASQ